MAGKIAETPLVFLEQTELPFEIYLKLENLQPIGSFKLRGAGNAMESAGAARLQSGVYTGSAGNMAQGVAWYARKLGIPCHVIVPEQAPQTKLDAIKRFGATYQKLPFDDWWQVLVQRGLPGVEGTFIHPVSDPLVMAGNGTAGLEIIEKLPDVDAIIVPYGGGGLSSGIASAVKTLKPDTKVYAAEVDTAAPFKASLEAGEPVNIDYNPSFVDGIGSGGLLPEMWPLVSTLLDGSLVTTIPEVADALRAIMVGTRTIAEGAGATSLASAKQLTGVKKVVCVVSGGNIDAEKLAAVLSGKLP